VIEVSGYRVEDKIGEGGMAQVYRGTQLSLKRPVAIKVLEQTLLEDLEVRTRFEQESFIIAKLNHPNIIHVIDRGISDDGQPYFIMEYIEGVTLRQLIKDASLEFNKKIDILLQIYKSLAYAHKVGVIHRDIKPANILLDAENNVKVLDFGIAYFYEDDSEHKTDCNLVMGTDAYMSPEQRQSARLVDERSDLYSLGVVAYELISGLLPIRDSYKNLHELDREIPQLVDDIIGQSLKEDPDQRPSSAVTVQNQLLSLSRGAHLAADQKARADEGLSSLTRKFDLLDIINENQYGAAYIYESRVDRSLFVLKKKYNANLGYKEATILSRLKHQNIVNIHGVSKNERLFVVVMDYELGGCLKDQILNPLELENFFYLAKGIGAALAFAHKNRILHGNFRPSNVLLTETGQVKISDFGLIEHYKVDDVERNWYSMIGERPSVRADIFSAGMTFMHMLIGLPGDNSEQKHVSAARFKALPDGVHHLLDKMIAPNSEDRYASFDEVNAALDRLLSDEKTRITAAAEQAFEPVAQATSKPKKSNGKVARITVLTLVLLMTVLFNIVFLSLMLDVEGLPNVMKYNINMLKSWLGLS